jgi:hypothetical protein
MKTRILYVDTSRFYNEQAFGYFSLIEGEFAKCNAPSFKARRAKFSHCLAAFDAVLELPRKNLLTQAIIKADRRRDNAYRHLVERVRIDTRHFKPEKAEAARQVNAILEHYHNPIALPYIQASGLLSNLVQDLDEPVTRARLTLLDIVEWLDELKASNDEFFALFLARSNEQAGTGTGVTRKARRALERAYRECVACINALVEVEGPEAYAVMIGIINQLVIRQRSELRARQTRAKKAKAGKADETQPGMTDEAKTENDEDLQALEHPRGPVPTA